MDFREAIEAIRKRLAEFFQGAGDDPGALRLDLDTSDLFDQLQTHRSSLLLGVYDEPFATTLLERAGALELLRQRAGAGVAVKIDAEEGVLRIIRTDRPDGPDATLVHVRVQLLRGLPPRLRELSFPAGDYVAIDSIVLQNPGRPFPRGRAPLPGQQHPGLGVGQKVLDVVEQTARRVRAKGCLGIPQYYHAAVMYRRRMIFVDPAEEGRFQALRRDLGDLSLEEATHAVHEGRVRDATFDEPYSWCGTEMALPLADDVREFFEDPRWADAAARTLLSTRFRIAAARP